MRYKCAWAQDHDCHVERQLHALQDEHGNFTYEVYEWGEHTHEEPALGKECF